MLALTVLRITLHGFAATLGSSGIFFLWASFYVPATAAYAVLFLTVATAITLTLPRPEYRT